jgi:hypothetical protein
LLLAADDRTDDDDGVGFETPSPQPDSPPEGTG